MIQSGITSRINTTHQCITVMKEYESKSLEELRAEDYQTGRRPPTFTAIMFSDENEKSINSQVRGSDETTSHSKTTPQAALIPAVTDRAEINVPPSVCNEEMVTPGSTCTESSCSSSSSDCTESTWSLSPKPQVTDTSDNERLSASSDGFLHAATDTKLTTDTTDNERPSASSDGFLHAATDTKLSTKPKKKGGEDDGTCADLTSCKFKSDAMKQPQRARKTNDDYVTDLITKTHQGLLQISEVSLNYTRNPFSHKFFRLASCKDKLYAYKSKFYDSKDSHLPHGTGKLLSPQGHLIYEGTWHLGKRHGYGRAPIVTKQDCDLKDDIERVVTGIYDGEWTENCRHGYGKMSFSSKYQYEGEWQFDQISGEGCLTLPGGGSLEGHWVRGQPQGYMIFDEPSGMREYHFYAQGKFLWSKTEPTLRPSDDIGLFASVECQKLKNTNRKLQRQLLEQRYSFHGDLCILREEKRQLKEDLEKTKREMQSEATLLQHQMKTMTEEFHEEKKRIKEECDTSVCEIQQNCDKQLEDMKSKVSVRETEMEKREECKMCYFAPRNCVILPCGHFMACKRCVSKHVNTNGLVCPYCKQTIESYRKVVV